MVEVGFDDFNVNGNIIDNFDGSNCSFDVYTFEPALENQTFDLMITATPVYSGLGDVCYFTIFISP